MMAALQDLFSTGWIAIIAGAILVIEILLVFTAFRHRLNFAGFFLNALSGLGLLAALYCALTSQDWKLIAGFLSLSLIGHLGDLILRLSNSKQSSA